MITLRKFTLTPLAYRSSNGSAKIQSEEQSELLWEHCIILLRRHLRSILMLCVGFSLEATVAFV